MKGFIELTRTSGKKALIAIKDVTAVRENGDGHVDVVFSPDWIQTSTFLENYEQVKRMIEEVETV